MEGEQKRGPLREIQRTLIGLVAAFGIVALFAATIFYFIPTFFSSQGINWSIEESESVSVYYIEDDLPDFDPQSYLTRVIDSKENIVQKLGIEGTRVPDRIRVYLHGDLATLKSAIAERKSSPGGDVPLAVMDVISGYEVEPVLVRLLTLFSWGRPSFEFLRQGLQSFFSNRIDKPHLRVAGLGDTAFSFSEITSLAETDNLPQSLHDNIYDSFDSPAAPAGMSLSGFSSLMRSEGGQSPYRYELEAEAGSFVSYLLDEHGVERFRALWKADSLSAGAERVYGMNLNQLEENWLEFVGHRSENSTLVRYYRSRTMLSLGKSDEALSYLNETNREELSEVKYHYLKGRIHFYRGEWEKARASFSEVAKSGLEPEIGTNIEVYQRLIETYGSGEKLSKGRLIVFTSGDPDLPPELLESESGVLAKVETQLPGLGKSYDQLRVFLSPDTEGITDWTKIDLPGSVTVVSDPNNFRLRVAEMVVARMSRTPTYSNLLRRGLIHYLAGKEVFLAGRRILEEGNWKSLKGITVNLDPTSTSSKIAAAFVGYILSRFEPEEFNAIWDITTPVGGDNSLDTALKKIVGLKLDQVEERLKDFLRSYES